MQYAYCIEAKVKKKFQNNGNYIVNARVEILERWSGVKYKLDPLYNLKINIKNSDPENISNDVSNVIASIDFSVESFLDGPIGFDARATDKFRIHGDSNELDIIQVHQLDE